MKKLINIEIVEDVQLQ